MADALSAREAYLAGGHDFEVAADQTREALKKGDITREECGKFFVDAIEHLWQARVDRGELVSDILPRGRAA